MRRPAHPPNGSAGRSLWPAAGDVSPDPPVYQSQRGREQGHQWHNESDDGEPGPAAKARRLDHPADPCDIGEDWAEDISLVEARDQMNRYEQRRQRRLEHPEIAAGYREMDAGPRLVEALN